MPVVSQHNSGIQNQVSKLEKVKIVVLAGGVGGAKLADGVAQIMPPENVTIVVNTGDDFQHLGLTICPDLDTVMYTLSGAANPETGWGREGESWRTIEEVDRLGGPAWFKLGDLDLSTHLTRSYLLAEGRTLTDATRHLSQRFGITEYLLPMSDQPAPTMIISDEGELSFQTWFVEQQWQPVVKQVRLPENVKATRQVAAALEEADLILIAPSNPFVSIDPILNVYPIREMISDLPEIVVAVSPIIAGVAVKGPAAKMMGELGMQVSSATIAEYYGELIDVFVTDKRENELEEREGDLDHLTVLQTDTLMLDRADRRRLANEILNFVTEQI